MAYKYYPDLYFTTASIYSKVHLFKEVKYADYVLSAFQFLVKEKRCSIFAFVIMSNHFHVIWQLLEEEELSKLQHSLLSFTSKKFLKDLSIHNPKFLSSFEVDKFDRKHQFWQRRPLSISLNHDKILNQKMNYLHENPVRAKIVKNAKDYHYCSYRSYLQNKSEWNFLTLW